MARKKAEAKFTVSAAHHGASGRRCSAHRSIDGEPCQRWASAGMNVCQAHGGKSGYVKMKAAERIREVRDKALEELYQMISENSVEPKILLDTVVKLTEVSETLEGKVTQRIEISNGKPNLVGTVTRVRDELSERRYEKELEA